MTSKCLGRFRLSVFHATECIKLSPDLCPVWHLSKKGVQDSSMPPTSLALCWGNRSLWRRRQMFHLQSRGDQTERRRPGSDPKSPCTASCPCYLPAACLGPGLRTNSERRGSSLMIMTTKMMLAWGRRFVLLGGAGFNHYWLRQLSLILFIWNCFPTGKIRRAIFVQIFASDQEGGGGGRQVWGRERHRERTSLSHCCGEKGALWWHGTMQWWLQEWPSESVYQNTSWGQWPVSLQLSTGRPQQRGRQRDPGKRLSPKSSPQAPPASQGAKPRAEQSAESGHPEVRRLPRHWEPPADQSGARDGERGTQKVFP